MREDLRGVPVQFACDSTRLHANATESTAPQSEKLFQIRVYSRATT